MTTCCIVDFTGGVPSEYIEDLRANEGAEYVSRFNGAKSREENEYLLGSAGPGFVISDRAAVRLRISVFHCLSSVADDALRMSSKLSSWSWNSSFHEYKHP